MKKFLMIGAGAMALAASGYAVAGPGMGGMIDANGDGNVTRAEATAASEAMFAKMDANGDGKIDEADREAKKRDRFDQIDANKDGKLTQAELDAHRKAKMAERQAKMAERQAERFAAMDKDGNKALSFDEFGDRDGMRGPRGDGPRAGGQDGPRGERDGKWGSRKGGHHGGKMMFKMADANNDGAVTAAEMRTAALAHFDKVDTNKDGTISAAERDAAKAAMRDAWKERREAKQ